MTAPSISPSASAQSHAPANSASASRTGVRAKSFAEVLENSNAPKTVSGKATEKPTDSSKDDKTQSPKESPDSSAALGLLSAIQQQHLPVDSRSWSLSLPKKEAPATEGATDKKSADAEDAVAPTAASSPQVNSKQQIAFEATLSKAELQAKAESQVNGAAANKLQQTIGAPAMDEKSNQSKQHSGSSNSGHESSSSNDSPADKAAATAISATSNAPAQFHVPEASMANAVASAAPVTSAYTGPAVAKSTQPAALERAAEIKEPVTAAAPRSPSIDLQAGDVNVRVSQRAGDVQITVRTADNDMAQSLRQHLPELADKLTQSGVHADLWQPSTAQSASSDHGADSQSNPNSQGQQESQNQQQSGTPEDRQNRQQRRQDWQEEFSFAGTNDR
ncbi:MAG TPA: flagellar hook-length control protein FliK [Bryobacteraceae bacterium]|jgi:hypothetical protein|nr:flagellar hook-length control protein FliK [Bryobacteraceae bacterium]